MYINNIMKLLKLIFKILILLLIVISFYPGNLLGYFLYGNLEEEPVLLENYLGPYLNHFFIYMCVSTLGLFIYGRSKKFKKVVYGLFFLATFLEILHLILPYRTFEIGDLLANILGVTVAYFAVKIYLFPIKT